ncbi:Uncharacterised protein [Enterobacter hormaechei]|nr:Uncharacterised protein [Enterobacter hormaechei]
MEFFFLVLMFVIVCVVVCLPRINYGIPTCHRCGIMVERPAKFCDRCRPKPHNHNGAT